MKPLMDDRVKRSLEYWIGSRLEDFTIHPFDLRISTRRSDVPFDRMVMNQINGKDNVIITCIPRLYDHLCDLLSSLTILELFSPLGMGEIKRVVGPHDSENLGQGVSYILRNMEALLPLSSEIVISNKNGMPTTFSIIKNKSTLSIASINIRDDSGVMFIDVETQLEERGKGYGAQVTSAAAQWIIEQGGFPCYGAESNNSPSIRIATKLGFEVNSRHIVL